MTKNLEKTKETKKTKLSTLWPYGYPLAPHRSHSLWSFFLVSRVFFWFLTKSGKNREKIKKTTMIGLCRKQLQRSIHRGMFYVFADKIGTVFCSEGLPLTTGNYLPCWVSCEKTYQVLGKWPETLWKQRKISAVTYEKLLFLTCDGVVSRKRNLEACKLLLWNWQWRKDLQGSVPTRTCTSLLRKLPKLRNGWNSLRSMPCGIPSWSFLSLPALERRNGQKAFSRIF